MKGFRRKTERKRGKKTPEMGAGRGGGGRKGKGGTLGMCALLSQMHSSGKSWLIPPSNAGSQFCSDL